MKIEQFNDLYALIELDGLCSALSHVADDIGDNAPEKLAGDARKRLFHMQVWKGNEP